MIHDNHDNMIMIKYKLNILNSQLLTLQYVSYLSYDVHDVRRLALQYVATVALVL